MLQHLAHDFDGGPLLLAILLVRSIMNAIPVCEAGPDPFARFPLEKIMTSLKIVRSSRVNIMRRIMLTITKAISTFSTENSSPWGVSGRSIE